MNKTFSERRATIVASFQKAAEDLSILNEEIAEAIAHNTEAIKSLKAEITELDSLNALNKSSIKSLSAIK